MKSLTSKKGIAYSICRNLSTSFLHQYKTGRHCSPQRRRFERLQEITETVVYGFDGCLKKYLSLHEYVHYLKRQQVNGHFITRLLVYGILLTPPRNFANQLTVLFTFIIS